jgi:adenylate cyclase
MPTRSPKRKSKAGPRRDPASTYSVLLDVMRSLAAERQLDDLLLKITQKASEVLDADRSTIFLVDEDKGELWSKVAQGADMKEIRVPLTAGIAGYVGRTGETLNIPDAYQDPRFNIDVDKRTGYRTRTILAAPMRNRQGKILGVVQVLNKSAGVFTANDETLLEAFASQAAIAVQNALLNEEVQKRMKTSEILLNVMREVSAELEIDRLLQTIVEQTSAAMNAERCTLFLVDRVTGELWSKVAQGPEMKEIRVPRGAGIVGHVANTGSTVNIPDAYKDPRFNPEVDKRTGYRTRSILTMPVRDEKQEIIGVMQVLNKRTGPFSAEDEELMGALASQTAIALENSRMFEEVRYMKNYNESMLRTMATGVVTLDPDGGLAYCNLAGLDLFWRGSELEPGQPYTEFFGRDQNPEIVEAIGRVVQGGESYTAYDVKYLKNEEETMNVNLHVLPLKDSKDKSLGVVVVADDITQEQRLMSTLSRYVTRQIAEQLLKDRDRLKLGGNRSVVAVLFSDIRNFTTLSERLSAEEVVEMLNDYFTRMIDPIFRYEGTLDKFIGDAIMAVFGAPVHHDDDCLRAVRCAIEMRRALREYNRVRESRGLPTIETGIGITWGEAVSGNIGSERRMDYTVIGDTVNVASRLEGLTKAYPCKILVNDLIYETIRNEIECVDLGSAQVKGKEGSVRIYGVPEPED